ncbi:hypothetical protein LPJ66_000988 [Kickxella alabastrina]|uniref:Uncharacterized protein n=1 Tax=Kickxella alabastrina TaxID=61397 RepID=A0ACC1IUM7_9FUNG|nr:hypothetical protein LPJ66_000988 [Kickxella alabastrina]
MGFWKPLREGGNYYYTSRNRAGMFTSCSIIGVGFAVVMTSTVFAGIRRATGITFRRNMPWPPIDVKTSEKLLNWYDSRIEQLSERAEERIRITIERYGADIEDPAIREVWEQQIRKDVMDKVERIRERRICCAELVQQAKKRQASPDSKSSRRHYPFLAVYLYIGEKVFDFIVCWMRYNPHFIYEGTDTAGILGSVSMEDLLRDGCHTQSQGQGTQIHTTRSTPACTGLYTAVDVANSGRSCGARGSNNSSGLGINDRGQSSSQCTPIPYIATCSQSGDTELLPEPSAPSLSESEFLGMSAPPAQAKSLSELHSSQSIEAGPSSRGQSQPLTQAMAPPPYTLMEDYVVHFCEESEEMSDYKHKLAIA